MTQTKTMKTAEPIVSPDDELVEMTTDEVKKKYMDLELVSMICDHMKKDDRVPMHLYATLAGVVGCSMGHDVNNKEQLGELLSLFGELCIDAAVSTFENKEKESMQ